MDLSRALLVVCLTLIIVIGINAALLAILRRGNEASQVDLFRRAAQRAKQPWIDEDEALLELSRRVADLKKNLKDTEQVDDPGEHKHER